MPELCPCGSELTLETCCVSTDIAKIKKIYVDSGRYMKRRDWAESYTTYKTIINEQIIVEQENFVKSQGREITCQAGCAMCCVEFIAARLEECDAIVMYLYSKPGVMNRFLINYKAWQQRITSGDNSLQNASEAYQVLYETRRPEDKRTFEAYALDYAKKYIPCPFLNDSKCLIYPIRPFVCSTYGVVSHKKYCDPKWHKEALENKQKIKSAINPLSFEHSYFIDLKGRMIFGPMPKMVNDIIQNGPYLMDKVPKTI